jgi:hypothetical protein
MEKRNIYTKLSCGTLKEEITQRGLGVGRKKILTLCHWTVCKDLIALPCVLDESYISKFLYKTSHTCISQIIFFIYCLRLLKA